MKRFNEESYLVSKREIEVVIRALGEFNNFITKQRFSSLEEKLEFQELVANYYEAYKAVDVFFTTSVKNAEEVEFKELLGIYKGKYSLEDKKHYIEVYLNNNRNLRATHRALKEELGSKCPAYESIRGLINKAKEARYI